MIFIKWLIWLPLSMIGMLLVSFVDAGLMMLFFNLAGQPFLAELGYWTLFWLNMAFLQPIGTAVAFGLAGHDVMNED